MNGSRDQKAQGNKNLFETFNVSTNEYLPQSFSVDLDQEDETPQVVGLMPHMDAMAMAAEASPLSISKPSATICMDAKPTVSYTLCPNQQLSIPIADSQPQDSSCVDTKSEADVSYTIYSSDQQVNVACSSIRPEDQTIDTKPETEISYTVYNNQQQINDSSPSSKPIDSMSMDTKTQAESSYIVGGNQQEANVSNNSNLCQNVAYVPVPSNLTPISVFENTQATEIQPTTSSCKIFENRPVTTQPAPVSVSLVQTQAQQMQYPPPYEPTTFTANEFMKGSRRKHPPEPSAIPAPDPPLPTSKLQKLEVRTLFVDFDKRKEDIKVMQSMFPNIAFRIIDGIYMKSGCDQERAIAALKQKIEEDNKKKQKDLEEWRKTYGDKHKLIKRVSGNKTPPDEAAKRFKFDPNHSTPSSQKSSGKLDSPAFPNARISDVKAYRNLFVRVEPPDASSRINAFMEHNVVEFASAENDKARPVKARPPKRYDISPCVRKASDFVAVNSVSATKTDTTTATSMASPPTSDTPTRNASFLETEKKIESPLREKPEKVEEDSTTVPLLGFDNDDDDDNGALVMSLDDDCGRVDDGEEDRLSTTSSNTRASNSSGGGGGSGGGNKFFRNKASTAAALQRRAYLSRELNQAWHTGNRRQQLAPPIELGASPASAGTTPITTRGKTRPRVWTASSDATPVVVTPKKELRPFHTTPSFTPQLHRSVDHSPVLSTPGQLKQSPTNEPVVGDRMTVLDFFNNAELEDLASVPSCSHKKARLLKSMRPFYSMKDLTTRLDQNRPLSSALIANCKELLQMRSNVQRLLTKCQKISSTVMPRVSNLISQVELDPNDPEQQLSTWQQPSFLNKDHILKPYQIVGVQWLKMLHSLNLNGILADEMGLGKTVQTIAFLAHLMETGDKGPHLVIVPSTTLENWCREFDMWCSSLRVLLYYGSSDVRKAMRKEVYEGGKSDFNILLTTYSVATNSIEDRTMMKKLDLHYGVFDEAHMLKNMTSQRYRYLMTFKVQRRLLLTGTPLQNNLLELMSLLSFVMPNLFGQREINEILKRLFQTCTRMRDEAKEQQRDPDQVPGYEQERIQQAKSLLRPFLLRRLKSQVLAQLPPKTDLVERVALPPVQRLHYVALVQDMREKLRQVGPQGLKSSSISVNMLQQLRKAANHTFLHRRRYTNETLREMARVLKRKEPGHKKAKEQLIYEDLCALNDFEIHKICGLYNDYIGSFALPAEDIISSSGKLMYLDAALPAMISAGDRVLLFSQFVMVLDVIEEFLRLRGYRFLRMDGTTRVVDRQELIDKFQTDPDIFVFLLSTRAGGLGINLTAANVVILHDIDYNPHNDRQAEDRCHRVGQARNVRVIRLLAANTVEESMHRLACDKLRLEEDITGDWVHTVDIKTEIEEENEDEALEGAAGSSRSRRDTSLSKAVEAREEEDLALKGSAAKELTELLREALYAADERGSVEAPQDLKAGKESSEKATEEKKKEEEAETENLVKEDKNNENEGESTMQESSRTEGEKESLGSSLSNLQMDVVEDSESQTKSKSQADEEMEQCSTEEPLNATEEVTENTKEKDEEKEEIEKKDKDKKKEEVLKEGKKEEEEASETVDEGASVHSAADKLSNPSEISEETRPLIISEQRISSDSEIDVVGER